MSTLDRKPQPGRLLEPEQTTTFIEAYLNVGQFRFNGFADFTSRRAQRLVDHERAEVALMRVPYSPYFDTQFILKSFKTSFHVQAHMEQVLLEAASLHHAAEAFRRNNIGRAPRVLALRSEVDVIAMECIRGRGVRDSYPEWWSKERHIKFIRQMAAIRIAMLTQTENQTGLPFWDPPNPERVGPYCGNVWWDAGRWRLWEQISRGPFDSRHEMILASMRRELVALRYHGSRGHVGSSEFFDDVESMTRFLEETIERIEAVPRPTQPEFFSLNHGDLSGGFNTMLRGGKIVAIIDWEMAAYIPHSMCVYDLCALTNFDPREWEAHAGVDGENFHVLPYRMYGEDETLRRHMNNYSYLGAELRAFPDWELIENHGGPLGEEDFMGEDIASDISSSEDESNLEALEMFCDSDAECEQECLLPPQGPDAVIASASTEAVRRGQNPAYLSIEWYYAPVYALMREFIHHQRGRGLGPDGEWGRLPEEYSHPLSHWEDPLFLKTTQRQWTARRSECVEEYMVGDPNRLLKRKRVAQQKTKSRKRKVPTLLDGWYGAAATPTREGIPPTKEKIPPEQTADSSDDQASPYPKPRPPRRISRSPRRQRTIRDPREPIPLSQLRNAPEPTRLKPWEKEEIPYEEPLSDDDARLRHVQDSIIGKVMERLTVRFESPEE
ncbi:hypothetical protein L873DRAFT_1841128 [Choiromyces venosus 120613-1]|uniref:Aminoglycoside phosphotransferase domain-containing protein n=1 Tax=Choiromyces venosus 120613-1 TaxID=1336337 RepID=A0A3N4JYP7_9PEZI|nr:hypothetical protein L873DRAFT_1841128 [Choiromyces venosus 120613-1]